MVRCQPTRTLVEVLMFCLGFGYVASAQATAQWPCPTKPVVRQGPTWQVP